MKITNVKITMASSEGNGNVKGYASITIDDCFVVHRIAILDREEGRMLSMPARRYTNGSFRDIAHPINAATRKMIEDAVFKEYEKALSSPEEGQAGESE